MKLIYVDIPENSLLVTYLYLLSMGLKNNNKHNEQTNGAM